DRHRSVTIAFESPIELAAIGIAEIENLTHQKRRNLMFIKNFVLRAVGGSLAAIVLVTSPRLGAQTPSESERLQKLERAVDQLQKRNAELEQEVSSLKKEAAVAPEGRMRTKVTYDGKTYVEKAVVEEERLP